MTGPDDDTWDIRQAFGGINGIYGKAGNQNPPIPYKGRVYQQRGNSLIAFKLYASSPAMLSHAETIPIQSQDSLTTKEMLTIRLEKEIQKMIDAGHLNPGYVSTGLVDEFSKITGEDLLDYWHHPFETLFILIRARNHIVNQPLLLQLDSYIQNEWNTYPPYQYNHIGWADGVPREAWGYPPEVEVDTVNLDKSTSRLQANDIGIWDFNPMAWYAMWQYAQYRQDLGFNEAETIFNSGVQSSNLMGSFERTMNFQYGRTPTVTNTELDQYAWAHNGYITGFIGFIKLYNLAVSQGMLPISNSVPGRNYTIDQYKTERDRLLDYRVNNFTIDTKYPMGTMQERARIFNASVNFMNMVPELTEYLNNHMQTKVQNTMDFYSRVEPYWSVARFDNTYDEGVVHILYDYHALFQAKAQILGDSYEDLVKYLDVPASERGIRFTSPLSKNTPPHESQKSTSIVPDEDVFTERVESLFPHVGQLSI